MDDEPPLPLPPLIVVGRDTSRDGELIPPLPLPVVASSTGVAVVRRECVRDAPGPVAGDCGEACGCGCGDDDDDEDDEDESKPGDMTIDMERPSPAPEAAPAPEAGTGEPSYAAAGEPNDGEPNDDEDEPCLLPRPDRGVEPLPVAMARGADADMCGCECGGERPMVRFKFMPQIRQRNNIEKRTQVS